MKIHELISIAQTIGATECVERIDTQAFSDEELITSIRFCEEVGLSSFANDSRIIFECKHNGGISYRAMGVIHENYTDALLYAMNELGIKINPMKIKIKS